MATKIHRDEEFNTDAKKNDYVYYEMQRSLRVGMVFRRWY